MVTKKVFGFIYIAIETGKRVFTGHKNMGVNVEVCQGDLHAVDGLVDLLWGLFAGKELVFDSQLTEIDNQLLIASRLYKIIITIITIKKKK